MGSTDAAARPGLSDATHPETEPALFEWRPHPRSRRNRVASDRLRFAFMYEKGGKGPDFRDSTGRGFAGCGNYSGAGENREAAAELY
jgi:hypothetical protein